MVLSIRKTSFVGKTILPETRLIISCSSSSIALAFQSFRSICLFIYLELNHLYCFYMWKMLHSPLCINSFTRTIKLLIFEASLAISVWWKSFLHIRQICDTFTLVNLQESLLAVWRKDGLKFKL